MFLEFNIVKGGRPTARKQPLQRFFNPQLILQFYRGGGGYNFFQVGGGNFFQGGGGPNAYFHKKACNL